MNTGMEFRKVLALRGPNIWANFPVLEAWVDPGQSKHQHTSDIAGFRQRLLALLPKLADAKSSDQQATFLERLETGVSLPCALEQVLLHLQCQAGSAVGFGRTVETNEPGVYKVAVEYLDEQVGRAALNEAKELILAALHNLPYDADARSQNYAT
ncbi:MAG TPA: hypothetical protein VL096_16795 [Pirellulaceae bacterium]|nr:hypothetical protein [Pirellulaceae bacterium]